MAVLRMGLTLLLGLGILYGGAGAEPPEEKPRRRTDFYGDPLPEGAIARCGTIRLRHSEHVHAIAFSPDGKLMATGGGDSVIRLWDAASGELRGRLTGHEKNVSAVAFAPDGETLVSGGIDK